MAADFAASLLRAALGLEVGSAGSDAANRVALEGLSLRPGEGGGFDLRVRRLEAAALQLRSGPFTVEVGSLAVHDITAQVGRAEGRAVLRSFEAAGAEIAACKASGVLPAFDAAGKTHATEGPWCLAPLAAAEGTLRAQIVDAHLLFDADVTVPIRNGQVEFRDATVEHVGPDSRMGVSRLGIYVDAPNGRSYLYQFSSAPMDGVEYERRGALLAAWVTDRGRLRLQPFGESLLRQPGTAPAMGVTQQARQLFDRTSLAGFLQPGDGRVAMPGVEAELAGAADRRNLVRLHSEAVGSGVTVEIGSLLVRHAVLGSAQGPLRCEEVTASCTLRAFVASGQLRLAFDLAEMKVSGLHLGAA